MAGANEAARGGLVIDFVVPSAVEAKWIGLPLVNISYIGQSKTCAYGKRPSSELLPCQDIMGQIWASQ
jgi:hypothetical protein